MIKSSVQTKKSARKRSATPGGRRAAKAPDSVARPLRSDGLATRQAILAAAFRCLVADGYPRLNMRDIARDAGVNAALINYHFRTKQQLVLEVMDEANRRLLDRQQRMYAEPAAVSAKWRQACDFYDEDLASGFVKLMIELMGASLSDATLRAEYLPRLLSWRRVVDDAVRDALAAYRLELPVSAQAIGTWIGCFWVGMEVEMALGVTEEQGHHREALAAVGGLLRLLEAGPSSPTAERRGRRKAASKE